MDMYPEYKSPLGYKTCDNKIDSYGVDHSKFSLRDEVEYQFARDKREQELINQYNSQGITSNYPQYGTNFWGNSDNNYGFGTSDISKAVRTHPAMNATTPISVTPVQQKQTKVSQNSDINEIKQKIFNGKDCGGMSAEFADKIAYAESRGNCRNNENNYGCVNKEGTAFGRYQMQIPALKDAGYMNSQRQFSKNIGISSMWEFLNNPKAQEQAMCNYLDKIDKYNQNWNNYKYLGKNIQVGNLNIPITKDMMLAGTHREGARKLNDWLNDVKVKNNNLVRDNIYDKQDRRKANITKRFEEILNPPK